MNAYFKKNVGSYCQGRNCSARRDFTHYVVYEQTFCEEHAKEACASYNIDFPSSEAFKEELDSCDNTRQVFDLLKKHLRLVRRESGGCPEENFPPDVEIYLVLGGEVISEINLNG